MKKILFLLLCTVSIYGQTSTGQEQEFDYGIKNNSLQTITTPTYIGTFGTDGTQGKIPSAYIAKTSDIADSLATKENIANKSDSYTVSSSTTYASTKALVDGLATKIGGTLTSGYIPKATGAYSLWNSLIYDNGTNVGIGNSAPSEKLEVTGNVKATSFIKSGGTSSQFLKADGSVDNNILSSNSSLSPPFYSENFSSGLFGSGWSSYGDAVWTIDVTDGNGDSFSAKSGDIVNLQRSVLVYSLTTTQETTALTFDYKTDSEPEYDWLEIKQNGKILDRFSGSNAWTTHTVYIQGIGTYDIQFVYEKDSGVSVGSDTVWIDNVKFSNDYQPTQVTNAVSFNNDVYFQNGLVTKDAYIENAVLKGSVRIYNFDEHNFATQLYRWGLLFKSPSGVTFGINSGETSDNSYSFHAQNGVTKTKMGYQTGYENGFIELPDLNAKTSFGGLLNSSYTLKNYGNSSFIGSSYFSDVVTIGSETAPVTAQLNISKSDVFGNYIYMEDVAASRKSLLFQGNSNSLDIVGFSFNSYTFNDIILRAQGSGNDQLRLKTSGNISIGNNNDSYKLDVSGTGRFSSTLTANSFIKSGGTSDQFLKADGSSDSSVYAPLASPTLTGTPTAPTATAGTNTTQIATTAFVQATRPYKVYTALLSQSGTSAPTATVLENTLGGTVVWTRSGIGSYQATLTGSAYTSSKTVVFATIGLNKNLVINGARVSDSVVSIMAGTGELDSTNMSIEIRVYN